MNDEDLLAAQRQLRLGLLDRPGAIRWRPARDLAAHLLLRLDEPMACWRQAATGCARPSMPTASIAVSAILTMPTTTPRPKRCAVIAPCRP